jgi:tape measure domain-containing protein
MATTLDVLARLRADTSQYTSSMRSASASATQLARASEGVGSKSKAGLGAAVGMMSRLTGVATIAGGVIGGLFASSTLQKGYQRLTTIQDATTQLTVSLGSAAKAATFMDKILATVKGTPFNLDQFADAASQMVSLGANAKKVPSYMNAIGEAAAGKGRRAAEFVGRLSAAFGQASTMGRITGDTLMQLEMAGVPATKILANSFGKTTEEFRKLVSKGAVPAEVAMDALSRGIIKGTTGAAGATKALSGTMAGLRKNLTGAVGGLGASQARLGAAIIKPFTGQLVTGLNLAADQIDKFTAKIKPILEGVAKSSGMKKFMAWLQTLPAMIEQGLGIAATMVGAAFKLLSPVIQWLVSSLFPALWGAIQTVYQAFVAAYPSIYAFGQALISAFGKYGPVVIRIVRDLGNVVAFLVKVFAGALRVLTPVAPAIAAITFAVIGANIVMGIYNGIVGFATTVSAIFTAATYGQTTAIAGESAATLTLSGRLAYAAGATWGFVTAKYAAFTAILRNIGVQIWYVSTLTAEAIASGVSTAATWLGYHAINAQTAVKNLAIGANIRSAATTVVETGAKIAATVATFALTAALAALNFVMSMNPIGLIILAIVALVAIVVIAYNKFSWFRTGVQAVWNTIKTVVGTALRFIGQAIVAYFTLYRTIIVGVWNAIVAVFRFAFNLIKTIVLGYLNIYRVIFTAGWNALLVVVRFVWNAIVGAVRFAATMIASVVSWIGGAISRAVGFVTGLPARIATAVAGIGSWLYNAGRNLIQGFVNGIRSLISAPVNAIRGMGGSALRALKSALGLASPSKYTMAMGRFTTLGLAIGITNATPSAVSASQAMGNAVVADLNGQTARVAAAAAQLKSAGAGGGGGKAKPKYYEPGYKNPKYSYGDLYGLPGSKSRAGYYDPKSSEPKNTISIKERQRRAAAASRRAAAAAAKAADPFGLLALGKLMGGAGGGAGGGGGGKAKKSGFDAASATIKAVREGITARITAAKADIAAIKQKMTEMSNQIRDSIVEFGSITQTKLPTGMTGGANYLVAQMQKRVDDVKKFQAQVDQLRKAGLNNTSLQEIINAGAVEGGTIAANLLEGGKSTIGQVNSLEKQLAASGTAIGGTAATSAYGAQQASAQNRLNALQGSMKVTNNNKTIKVEKGAVSVSVNVGNLKDQKAVDSAVEAAVNRAFTKLTRTLAAKS